MAGLGVLTTKDIECVDDLPPGLRDCVHEFGWSVVQSFIQNGIKKPAQIRHLVNVVRLGSREPGNKRGEVGAHRSLCTLDEFLLNSESKITARALVGMLKMQNIILTTDEPYGSMISASILALKNAPSRVTVEEKHRLSLRAAIRAGAKEMWPFLYEVK